MRRGRTLSWMTEDCPGVLCRMLSSIFFQYSLALGLSVVDAARGKEVFHEEPAPACMNACALVVLASRFGIKRRLHYFTNHIFFPFLNHSKRV